MTSKAQKILLDTALYCHRQCGLTPTLEQLKTGELLKEIGVENPYLPATIEEFATLQNEEYDNSISKDSLSFTGTSSLYQATFSPRERQPTGEWYTPVWCVEMIIDRLSTTKNIVGYKTVDPACGVGAFLIPLIKYYRGKNASLDTIIENIIGCELNPISAQICIFNYIIEIQDLLSVFAPIRIPVYCGDTLEIEESHPAYKKCEYIVGNPPWVALSLMSESTREKTLVEAKKLGLCQEHEKVGTKNLATIFTAKVTNILAAKKCTLALVVPTQTILDAANYSFRLGRWGDKIFETQNIIDFCDLKDSRSFPISTCVIFGEARDSDDTAWVPYPLTKTNLLGCSNDTMAWEEVQESTKQVDIRFTPKTPFKSNNYYKDFCFSCPAPSPRIAFYYIEDTDGSLVSDRSGAECPPWKNLESIRTSPPKEFVHDILLAEHIVPFSYRYTGTKIVYPMIKTSDGFKGIPSSEWEKAQYSEHYRKCDDVLSRYGKDYKDLVEGKDVRGKNFYSHLTHVSEHFVCLNLFSQYPFACVMSRDSGMLLGKTVMVIQVSSEDEAHYLSAIFNSNTILNLLKSFKGITSLRSVRGWATDLINLPVPVYSAGNETHARLSFLAREMRRMVDDRTDLVLADRVKLFKELQAHPIMIELESLVKGLLDYNAR